MAMQRAIIFLEEWLQNNSGDTNPVSLKHTPSSSSSAQAIVQSWADLRDSLQNQSFRLHHLRSLRTLAHSQSSLYVADPQAKILLSLLSSEGLSLPSESYPLFLRLLYIWIRKSSRQSSSVTDSAVETLVHLFSKNFYPNKSSYFFSEGVLLLGALSASSSASEASRLRSLKLLSQLLEEEYRIMRISEDIIPSVLAGIAYALSSRVNVYFVRLLNFLFGLWKKEDGPSASISQGLMILHLTEWVLSNFISSHSWDEVKLFRSEILEKDIPIFASFAVVMAAAGVVRIVNRSGSSGLLQLKASAERRIDLIARELIAGAVDIKFRSSEPENSLLLRCISSALARSGSFSYSSSILVCLCKALLTEIFPLNRFYTEILELTSGDLEVKLNDIKEHLNSTIFKEAGAITGVFCNQYVTADEENKNRVENCIWDYSQDIYLFHRSLALVLRDRAGNLLEHLEKIAESAFLMVVVFSLAVTKNRLDTTAARENRLKLSVSILASFSCMEYFRRMRLPEYMDTIRAVVTSVQENESACILFVETMPSYNELTSKDGISNLQILNYSWSNDEVQTARILFYLRVIPTCVDRLPGSVFRKIVAPIMFLYVAHPNGKVARASHSMFVSFISSGEDPHLDERIILKEQLVYYYIKRSLEEYPGITPFEGVASGVAALVRHLPAGSPAVYYCVHSLIEKANFLCGAVKSQETDVWKNWEGDLEPAKKMLELLIRLLSLVDIQVLPCLMQQFANLVVQLPRDGQKMVLNELYQHVAESDDVTRKPTLVSWLQSLSYLLSQHRGSVVSDCGQAESEDVAAGGMALLSLNRTSARL